MFQLAVRETSAELIVELTGLALAAPDVPSAVTPILERLVDRTAAVGSAYFQLGSGGRCYHARAATGKMPDGPGMDTILTHGLPAETPLLRALTRAAAPLFYDDTARAHETAGFPDLGVASMAAAPVRDAKGDLLGAFLMHTFLPHDWTVAEADLFAAVSGMPANLAARLVAEERAVIVQEQAVRSLGLALEYRDRETKGHTDRVTDLALRLGGALGLGGDELRALQWGAYLHDIGKMAIPDSILLKPGRLDAIEWALMRTHSQIGYTFAQLLEFLPIGTMEVIRSHHERWDGGGYAEGLAGGRIPLLARIFAVADVYDALISERPYKRAWSHAEALAEIRSQAGLQFDPSVVEAFAGLGSASPPRAFAFSRDRLAGTGLKARAEPTKPFQGWTRGRDSGGGVRPWGLRPRLQSPCHPPVTGLRRTPTPPTSTSIVSPARIGPTPSGVPVRITSPG